MLTAVLFTQNEIQAQKSFLMKNDLKVGYGTITFPEMASSFMILFVGMWDVIAKDSVKEMNTSFYGNINIAYERRLKQWISIGAVGTFNPVFANIETKAGLSLSYNFYIVSLMPQVNFYYMRKDMVSLYSGLAVGGSLLIEEDRNVNTTNTYETDLVFAYQANFFGFRIGKEIAGYAEFGMGFKGIINIGISGRF